MARRKQDSALPTPPPARIPADRRPLIYYVLDQLMVVIYAYTIAKVIPNRLPSVALQLWSIPVCMQIMAIGTAMVVAGRFRSRGRWIAIAGGSALLLTTIILIVRVLVSAAFLAGVYGAFGKAAATFALVAIALVIELVALLPIVQIKYLMSRAGRRAYDAS